MGTPQYMSPEGVRGQNSQLDARADQWALSVILYRALSGQLPFNGDDMMGIMYRVAHEAHVPLIHLVPGLPAPVATAIERGLRKAKEERLRWQADE